MKSQSELKLVEKLNTAIEGDVLSGPYHCGRYATDASVYQMMPLGVVLPKTHEDVKACLEIAKACGTAVLARGGGTSQCGQTVNQALVIDHSRYMNQLVELDVENRRCLVEPGIVLLSLIHI